MGNIQISEQSEPRKGYVALSLSWQWEIERIQNAISTIFGYDDEWYWVDPYTLHLTLYYADLVSDEQLVNAAKALVGMNAPDLHIVGIGVFPDETNQQQIVYLKVEMTDALVEMQKAVFDSMDGQGVVSSPMTDPAQWVAHIALVRAPIDAVIPQSDLDIFTYTTQACLSRADYDTLMEIPLKWEMPDRYGENGIGPVQEMASWRIGASGDQAVGADVAWDGAAAAKSIFDAGKIDSDSPDYALIRKGFLIYNASAPKLRGSYKLPIAKYSGGKLVIVPAGVRNAASRLPQLKGVPAEVVDKATKRLDSIKKKAKIGEMATTTLSDARKELRLTLVSEMRGNFPNIPLPDDIDMVALKEITGQTKLDFFTLPIGQVNATSGNGRTYLQSAVQELVDQVNEFRPEGIWGHMGADEMGTRYDPPAVRWLAAMLDDEGIAWGKLLPLTEETLRYYQIARATNARVATSLTALAEMQQNDVLHIALHNIDVADPNRAGIAATVAVPQLTQEMSENGEALLPQDSQHDILVRVRNVTKMPANSEVTPATNVTAVIVAQEQAGSKQVESSDQSKKKEINSMTEITYTQEQYDFVIGERAKLQTQISELTDTNGKLLKAEESHLKTIGELVQRNIISAVTEQVMVEDARDLIVEQVIAMQPQNAAEVASALKTVLDKPSVQKFLKVAVKEQMGPPQNKQQGAGGIVIKSSSEATPENGNGFMKERPARVTVPSPNGQVVQ